jgi:predicted MPP superfamily phosphohydrolase
MRELRIFLVFFSMVVTVMGSVHGYLYLRLVHDARLPGAWPWVLGSLFAALALSLPLAFIANRKMPRRAARFVVVPVFLWLGFTFLNFFWFLGLDVLRVVAWAVGRILGSEGGALALVGEPEGWRLVVLASLAVTVTASLFSVWWALTRVATNRIEIPLHGLPPELDGFTIAHLTDLHLDHIHGRRWLGSIVDRTNALQPDLVAITGDLAEGSVAQYGDDVMPLARLRAPHGTFFVTGNHEYFHDLRGWLEFLPDLGIRVLRNERAEIRTNGGSFDLAGIDDQDAGRMAPGHGSNLQQALEGWNPDRGMVLLAHQPLAVLEAAKRGIGVVLSGHTHGGQIWPFSYLVLLQQPFIKGLKKVRDTYLYLSSGTGFWGPPMRLGTTAEIALVVLRAKAPT